MADETPTPDVTISCEREAEGKFRVTAKFGDGSAYTDVINIALAADRERFADALLARWEGLDEETLQSEMERLAAVAACGASEGGGGKMSQATRAVELVEQEAGVELFHAAGGHDAEGFATFTVKEHRETWPIRSNGFRHWLSHMFYLKEGKVPGGQAISDALMTLSGKAIHQGPELEVNVRIARHEQSIWLDLGDEGWRAVQITASGWQVVSGDAVPVRFVRKRGMMPLPAPVRGGSINRFRYLVNLPTDEVWVLVIAWAVAAFRPRRPFAVLNVNGEQGCAKSTLCKMLRALIDPGKPPLRRPPKNERDLAIAGTNAWVVAYDNISGLPDHISDSLCSLSTGGGFGTRELYTDGDEKLFEAIRPVIINGIDDSVTRPDLLDRSLNVFLPLIPPEQRRDEEELWEEFERERPAILGALLDAVSAALANVRSTKLERLPRMADFARWIVAAERALPWPPGTFLKVYADNRADAQMLAIESSPIGPPVLALIAAEERWSGTASDLLTALEEKYADLRTKKQEKWPKTAKAAGAALRRIASNLRATGVQVTFPKQGTGHKKRKLITLEQTGSQRSAPSARSADPPGAVENEGGEHQSADHCGPSADHCAGQWSAPDPPENPVPAPAGAVADHADHADRSNPARSKEGGWGVL